MSELPDFHGPHVRHHRADAEVIDWCEPEQRFDRVWIRRHTCEYKALVLEFCTAGGLAWVRRTDRLADAVKCGRVIRRGRMRPRSCGGNSSTVRPDSVRTTTRHRRRPTARCHMHMTPPRAATSALPTRNLIINRASDGRMHYVATPSEIFQHHRPLRQGHVVKWRGRLSIRRCG